MSVNFNKVFQYIEIFATVLATIFAIATGVDWLVKKSRVPDHKIELTKVKTDLAVGSTAEWNWNEGQLISDDRILFEYDELTITANEMDFSQYNSVVIVANRIKLDDNTRIYSRNIVLVVSEMSGGIIAASGINGSNDSYDGENGGAIIVAAGNIEGTNFIARGGNGVDGRPGSPGLDGTPGRNGRNGRCDGFGGWRKAQPGGNGSPGGTGGAGENCGNGGNGGHVKIITQDDFFSLPSIEGGSGGRGGRGGEGGKGGSGGRGGAGCTGLGGSQSSRSNGADGPDGPDGEDGRNGINGNEGNFQRREVDFHKIAETYYAHEQSPAEFINWLINLE